jgi:O-acetyl-ADP-ribose deacetylase (regulator of RNase III)
MKIVKGDLLDLAEQGHFDVIVHGCNCFNTMGGGIAAQIKKRFPEAYMADQDTISGYYNKLGCYSYARVYVPKEKDKIGRCTDFHEFVIVNAYTQYFYGKGHDMFEYAAFELILKKLQREFGSVRYGFPLIGCGLAGGNKERILKLIEDFDIDDTVTVVEFG